MQPIDAHTHAFSPAQVRGRAGLVERDPTFAEMYASSRARMASVEDIGRTLAREGFAGGVVAGFAFRQGHDGDELNEYLLAAREEAQVPLAVLATVNPACTGWEHAASGALAAGADGFGELRPGNQGWDPLGEEASRLYSLARDAGKVLLWHVSEPVGHEYDGKRGGISPRELCRVAEHHPGLKQIAAHLGGGLPFFLQMPEVRAALHDIWFDTAATSLLYDDVAVARVVELAGPDRVLFGSDYPLLAPRKALERVVAALGSHHTEDVCGRNVRQLFGGLWTG